MKKSAYTSSSFFESLTKYKPKQKVYSRSTQLTPQAVHKTFRVHNGLTFLPVTVSEEMVGHKLGEFAQTRRRYYFKKKQTQKKKKK